MNKHFIIPIIAFSLVALFYIAHAQEVTITASIPGWYTFATTTDTLTVTSNMRVIVKNYEYGY